MTLRALSVLLALSTLAWGVTPGYVSIQVDSIPTQVYVDAITVLMDTDQRVVEVDPGKHFVSLFPPRKVYLAASEQAPGQFWERLRSLGMIGDEYGLLASYEAGSIRVGTAWIYATPEETTAVRLSRAAANRRYLRDSGCVTKTFLGWVLLIGAGMIASVTLVRLSN